MTPAAPTVGLKPRIERRVWEFIAVVSLLPGIAYFAILMLALVFGVVGPAKWLGGRVLDGVWAVPVLWFFVIGGPTLSVISSLILGLWKESGFTLGKVCGVGAWILLAFDLVTCVPFPFVLAIE